MSTSGGKKLSTLNQVAPGKTVSQVWNNASWDIYRLDAWPVVLPGVSGSAEITKISYVVHGNPSERELHYSVKNTGTTTIDIDVWAFFWRQPNEIVLHIKVLTTPTIALETMIQSMRDVYGSIGINVKIMTREDLTLPLLNDIDVGSCSGTATQEQIDLFANRNNVGANELVAYFVRSTIPAYNGCATHPQGQSGAVVVQGATRWTLAHEIGHVLGLSHVNNNDHLMTGNGTSNITNPPPDISSGEATTMKSSDLTAAY